MIDRIEIDRTLIDRIESISAASTPDDAAPAAFLAAQVRGRKRA